MIYNWGSKMLPLFAAMLLVFLPCWYFMMETWKKPWDILYIIYLLSTGYFSARVAYWMLLKNRKRFSGQFTNNAMVLIVAYFGMWLGYFLFRWFDYSIDEYGDVYYTLVALRSFVGSYLVALTIVARRLLQRPSFTANRLDH